MELGRAASDKRERLVAAATRSFHRHGLARSSLADVARMADVAPGNVFYYFRTKDELANAVVDGWSARIEEIFGDIEREPDPIVRVQAFLDRACANRAIYAELGCPIAAINRDRRLMTPSGFDAERTFAKQLGWLGAQFVSAGLSPADAKERARFVVSGLQGAIVLAHAHADGSFVESGVKSLKRWLDAGHERGA